MENHMTNMVPLESSPLFGVFSYGGCSSDGGGFTDGMMIREATINNQDSSGETCSVSDPTAASTSYYNISSPQANKDYGSASKSDVVSCINVEDDNKDKSWLRLGIGPEENNNRNNTASYKLQRCCSKKAGGREHSLELSLFSSSSTAAGAVSSSVDHSQPQPPQPLQPPYSHDQLLTMRGASLVYNHQLVRPQTLFNRDLSFPSSKPWMPQYTAPFRPSSLGMMSERDVTNNNSVTRSCCVEEGGAGPSSEFRVLDPPRRPHSGLWFLLQASQFQEKEPFLPQVNKSYLRIKDGRITVRLLIKYLMKKLQLDSESQIEIRCRGQQLSPLLAMQHVRDTIWSPKSSLPSSSPSFTLLRDSSTSDHVMILHYVFALRLTTMAYGSFALSSKALVFCRPCYGSIRDLPFSLRTPTIGHCGCVGAIAAPRNLVKPRKEESRDFSRERRSKEKAMPWKKLDASEFGIQRSMIPESTRMVLNKLRKKGFQVYLVGGCVRDLILDRIPKDFDVITSAELKEVRKVFTQCQIVGRRFPICHVYVDDIIIEVSSFSTSARTGKAPNKAFRKPAGCSERDYIRWKNCLQRDFTVNGLMFDPLDNVVYDYVGGVEDLRSSKVRTVSSAKLSFVEDKGLQKEGNGVHFTARILRAIRIAARLGFSLTKDVAVSVKELSSSLLLLDPSRVQMEINYMLAYGSAEASLRLLWRFGLMEILLPVQASYFVSQGFRRRDGRSNMLLSMFRNLDRLVAPDRPCHEIGILALHKALVDQPRDPKVVASYCLAIYSEVSLSEAIEIAKSNSKQHSSNFQELSEIVDSDSKLSQQVMSLADSIKSAARKLSDRDYLANAMSKYPQAPSSDMVFMSRAMLERVQKMFGSVRRKGNEERGVPSLDRRINYKSLALGDFHETRRVFARIVFDTVYPPT
ncbi:unnamed protein product [Thlaspi arvense]|uniref:Polynucleotide adenylyltransferase n=1 Tax=Thlaspi arvense TaxID=13288 RepID=A0AAU9R5F8_THLAR|nr:unnamed protein product [Thlaspi arvense]